MGAADTGLGARRSQAAGKATAASPPRVHNLGHSWRAAVVPCLRPEPTAASLRPGPPAPAHTPAVAVLTWLGSVQQNTHCLWDTVPGQPPDPRRRDTRLCPSWAASSPSPACREPPEERPEATFSWPRSHSCRDCKLQNLLGDHSCHLRRNEVLGSGEKRSGHQTSTRRDSCGSSAGTGGGPGAGGSSQPPPRVGVPQAGGHRSGVRAAGLTGLPGCPSRRARGPALPASARREQEPARGLDCPSGPSSRLEEAGAPAPARDEPSRCWPGAFRSWWPGLRGWSQTRRDPTENAQAPPPALGLGAVGGHTTGRSLLVQRRLLWVPEVNTWPYVGMCPGWPGCSWRKSHVPTTRSAGPAGLREAPACLCLCLCLCTRLPPAPSLGSVPSSTGRLDTASASVVCGAGPPLTKLDGVQGG